jgi:hypothetical protein
MKKISDARLIEIADIIVCTHIIQKHCNDIRAYDREVVTILRKLLKDQSCESTS